MPLIIDLLYSTGPLTENSIWAEVLKPYFGHTCELNFINGQFLILATREKKQKYAFLAFLIFYL